MNRARWYSSSTTLLNGETYIQGGSGGTDRPEMRECNGAFRLLSGANTGAHSTSCFPAISSRRTVASSATTAPAACTTSIPAAPARSRRPGSSAVPPAPTRLPPCSGRVESCSSGAIRAAHSSSTSMAQRPSVTTTQSLTSRRRLVQCDDPARRQGARDRRERRLERNDERRLHRGHLESGDRSVDAGRQRPARAPVPLEHGPDARGERAGAWRRRAGPPEQHQRRGLLPAVPVQRGRRVGGTTRDRRRTDRRSTSARHSRSTSAVPRQLAGSR